MASFRPPPSDNISESSATMKTRTSPKLRRKFAKGFRQRVVKGRQATMREFARKR